MIQKSIRLTAEHVMKIKEISKQEGDRSPASIIREAIDLYYKQRHAESASD
jgi:predicted DNA-binding protein